MENLLEVQQATAEKIRQLYINYKKDGDTRKTIRYLEAKIDLLKSIYKKFVEVDDQIRAHTPVLPSSHEYFQERKSLTDLYNLFIEEMRKRLNNAPTTPTLDSLQIPTFTYPSTTNAKEQMGIDQSKIRLLVKQQDIRIRCLYKEIRAAEDLMAIKNKSRQALNLKLKNMERMIWQIMDLHEKICMEASEEDEHNNSYFVETHYENINEHYNNIVLMMTTELEENEQYSFKPTEIRLPAIEIPRFDGDHMKWVGFSDTFKRLVHENNHLTDTHKINYLKGHVVGTAAKLLSHLEPSGDNYKSAWEILENRFSNRRLLISNLLSKLLGQPASNSESASAIKNLHDTTVECLYAIRNTGISIETWNPFLIYMLTKKLDNESRRLYESSLDNPREFQSTSEFLIFLERRFQSLEAMGSNKTYTPPQQPTKFIPLKKSFATTTQHNQPLLICICCHKNHSIESCSRFKELSTAERNQLSMLHKLCRRCLTRDHETIECKTNLRCSNCKGKHHTLLHQRDHEQEKGSSHTKLNVTSTTKDEKGPVLLATAIVKVSNNHGSYNLLRALIDPGSQATFITEEAAQLLGLPRTKILAEVSGISASKGKAHHQINIDIHPRFPSLFNVQTQALVLKTITKPLPERNVMKLHNKIQDGIILADPTFDTSGPIDLLIGAEVYGEIILEGIKKVPLQKCVAQRTEIGWIISGQLNNRNKNPVTQLNSLITLADIDKQLKQFWESEELHPKRTLTKEELECEEYYQKTHKRLANGRYEVRIPFNNNGSTLGESKQRAAARLQQIEKRLQKEESYRLEYHRFMNEYIQLRHMELVHDDSKLEHSRTYYLPHHAVIKADSTTTKLRVVFDASCKTTTNTSLNQLMLVGPTLQDDLTTILIRWRKHRYVFTADIEKMFRQIRIAEQDTNYQLILWRSSKEQKMRTYKLKTVTYGTAAATYLATRTLKQLALDDADKYPLGSQLLLKDFYVDDLLTGADTLEEAIAAQKQLYELLSGGGFNLRKWNSNDRKLLKHLPEDLKEFGLHAFEFDDTIKTLGLHWNSSADIFQIKVKMPEPSASITKRNILSEASKIFDPLGWLAPVVITAKILLQDLWASGVDWDVKVQPCLEERWRTYKQELPELEKIKINRWINHEREENIQLHGFCDASNQAYAAIVYAKAKGVITVVAAKSKVAPLNQTLSLPRLELNGAVLLSKLITKVKAALELNDQINSFCWTDSMAVLGWIKGKPQNHKTFVANRITEIQSNTNPSQWHHVISSDNPADCASRGINPTQLLNHTLWWEGPPWLKSTAYPMTNIDTRELELAGNEERKTIQVLLSTTKDPVIDVNRFSSLQRLTRSIAYCHRFMSNTKLKTRDVSHLKPEELKTALRSIIKIVQSQCFQDELIDLNNKRSLSKKSTILTLNPFIDGEGVLRVGGRLENSNLTFNEKHPVLLPRSHQLCKLIIRDAHNKTLHGGNQVMLAHIRGNYWILNAKDSIRQSIRNCVTCTRARKQTSQQLMGALPAARVIPAPPFTNSGVDYAGPIILKLNKGRCNKTDKGYIAIFVCMATKAVHLELVTDLSTEAFLAAFKRFTSRRGLCIKIFSDCGTNFIGANNQLKKQFQEHLKMIPDKIVETGTDWHFIPPGNPHFGGLWEAGVKSMKRHLQKVIGSHVFTFEELTTILAQIEACLNSRPLTSLSNDIEDEAALTPGHFLIGRQLIATPEPDMTNIKYVTRWNLLTKISQQFWKQWSSEYLSQLQRRPKWLHEVPEIEEGELVLVKDEQLPPTKWPLARIVELHPGQDKHVRVVTLKQNDNILKRNITKICRLPSGSSEVDSNKSNAVANNTRSKTKGADTTTLSGIVGLLALFLIMNVQTTAATNDFQVTFWNNTPGIYFEEIGTMQLLSSRWKLVVHYDLESYWKEITNILNYVHVLNTTCQTMKYEEDRQKICDVFTKQFYRQVTTINQQNKLIHKFNKHQHRFKRGLGDTVGLLLGDMFGVLTQREAEHYEDSIRQTKTNEEHLLTLIKDQTSIIDATVNVVKHDHDASASHFNQLQHNMQKLSNTSDLLIERNQRHDKVQSVLVYAIQMMLVMKDLQDTQNSIINVLTHSQHGTVHPSLVTPNQLETELRNILENIPPDSQLPGGNNLNNLADVYKMMTIKYRVTRNKIVFLIQLPLANVEVFQLYNQLAVPVVNKGTAQCIRPSTKYLAVNKQRERHTPINQHDFDECIEVKDKQYLCEVSPIYNKQSHVSVCELNLLQHNTNIHPSCKLEFSEATDSWIKTWQSNTWIFSLREEAAFDLFCNKNYKIIRLKGTGIFSFLSNCVLRGNSFVITAVAYNTNVMQSSYLPSFNLSFITNELNTTQSYEDIVEQPQKDNVLVDLKAKIQQLQEKERERPELNNHDVHHYTISYTTVAIMIILAVIIYIRIKKQPRVLEPLQRANPNSDP